MIRSVLALAALLAFAVSSGAAFAGSGCGSWHVGTVKQTVASVDGQSSKPVTVPTVRTDG